MVSSIIDLLSEYSDIKHINNNANVILVQHNECGYLAVKKILEHYNMDALSTIREQKFASIPQIYEMIEYNNRLYVVEEYIIGKSLEELIDSGKEYTELEVANIGLNVCKILKNFHTQKPVLVHRDVKPSNIICSYDDKIYLVDFDAAKTVNELQNMDTVLIGTNGFAAPEQYGFMQSDARTDIYGLGVTLNYLLTGKAPRDGIHKGVLHDILKKCVELNPNDRYSSVDELRIDLLDIL